MIIVVNKEKKKLRKQKCKLVKEVNTYINGRLVDTELTYKCKPKVRKVCRCYNRQKSARELLIDWLY